MSSNTAYIAANEGPLLAEIAALRESLKRQRERARNRWEACSGSTEGNALGNRSAMGRFTEQLLKDQTDGIYS